MNSNFEIEGYWQAFIQSLPPEDVPAPTYQVWYFGNTKEMANELGRLVIDGIKTATCSLLWEYESGNEPLTLVGDVSIITEWDGSPLCIIETTEVIIQPFNEVDEEFAHDEGEGDRSYDYWRETHWQFFSKLCESIGKQANETMPLVCERFRVIFS